MPNLPPPPPPSASSAIDPNLIAKKRAEVQAKLAAMKLKMSQGAGAALPTSAPPPPPPSGPSRPIGALAVPGLPTPNLDPDLAKKVADAKKLVESFQAKSRMAAAKPINPYLVRIIDPLMLLLLIETYKCLVSIIVSNRSKKE